MSPTSPMSPDPSPAGATSAPSSPQDPPHDIPALLATPLRERAWSLFCQGRRSPAIAQSLGVPERTVRGWITAIQAELAADTRDNHHEAVRLAVARQLAIAASAWESYERVAAYERRILDPHDPLTTDDDDNPTSLPPLHLPHVGARYLTIAMNAQREAARLQGLYVYVPPAPGDVHLTLSRVAYGPVNLPDDQRAAWEAFVRTYNPFGQTPDDLSEFDEIADPLGLFPPPPGAAAFRPTSSPSNHNHPPARDPHPDPDPAALTDDDDDTATYEDALAEEPQDPADESEMAEWTRRNDERLRLRALAHNRPAPPAPPIPTADYPPPSGREAAPIPPPSGREAAPIPPPSGREAVTIPPPLGEAATIPPPSGEAPAIPPPSGREASPIPPLAPLDSLQQARPLPSPAAPSPASPPSPPSPTAHPHDHKNRIPAESATPLAPLPAPIPPTPPPNPDPDYGYPPPPVKIRRLHFPPGATFRPV